jgi:hypothetical protein
MAAPDPTWKLTLREGIDAYDRGNYRDALRRLQEVADDSTAPLAQRVEALKYMAFAHCSMNQRLECRLQFEKALAVDSSFDLAPAERGHPIWGPEFQRAKSARQGGLAPESGGRHRVAYLMDRPAGGAARWVVRPAGGAG